MAFSSQQFHEIADVLVRISLEVPELNSDAPATAQIAHGNSDRLDLLVPKRKFQRETILSRERASGARLLIAKEERAFLIDPTHAVFHPARSLATGLGELAAQARQGLRKLLEPADLRIEEGSPELPIQPA